MKAIGFRAREMDMASRPGQMVLHIKVNGRIICLMAKESSLIPTAMFTMANGKKH